MTKYLFIENEKINGCGEIKRAEPEIINLEVSDEIYNNYIIEPYKFIYKSGSVIQNPEYEKLKTQKEISDKISAISLQLEILDKKRIRAVCENTVKNTESGQTWLEYYNEKKKKLREQIFQLSDLL